LEKLKLVRKLAAACTESNRKQFYNSTPNNNLIHDAKWWNQYACHVFLLFGTKPMLDMKKGAGAINSYIYGCFFGTLKYPPTSVLCICHC
jgi:hypothetical protein